MKVKPKAFLTWIGRNLGAKFSIGLITAVPVGVTVWILWWGFNTIDNVLQPFIKAIWGHTIPGVGFGITVVFIYLVGILASNVIGKRLIRYGESALPWMPVVRQLYTGIKQIIEGFTAPSKIRRMQPVITEFPRKGMKVVGFATNEVLTKSGKKLVTVFIPTSPNPTSGYLQIVDEDEVVRTDMSVENALKMVVSAGKVLPEEVVGKLAEAG